MSTPACGRPVWIAVSNWRIAARDVADAIDTAPRRRDNCVEALVVREGRWQLPENPFEALDYPLVREDFKLVAPRDAHKVGERGERRYLHAPEFELTEPFTAGHDRAGGAEGYLGLPTGNRLFPGAIGAAELQEFEGGALLRAKGSAVAHAMSKPLYKYWRKHRLSGSYGYPIADEIAIEDTGRYSRFEGGGGIYWWPDIGALHARGITFRYVGLACFGTTNGLGDDEPYFVFTVASTMPKRQTVTRILRTPIYDDVEEHTGVYEYSMPPLFRAELATLWVNVELYEHDAQPPDDVVQKKRATLNRYPNPIEKLGEIENALFGDDFIAISFLRFTMKELVELAGSQRIQELGIVGRVATEAMSGQGSTYKAIFDVTLEQRAP